MKRAVLLVLFFLLAFACETYVPAPEPELEGLDGGVLGDTKAPLVVTFGKPVDPATLRTTVAFYDVDDDGYLPDETDPPGELRVLFRHDPSDGDRGGHVEIAADGASATLVPDGALPVGPKLVLLVEPGLTATDGRTRTVRTRIPFSYRVSCAGGQAERGFASGVYFVVLEVEHPIGTQIRLFGAINVDPATGLFVGQFTDAIRNPAPGRCPMPCDPADVCRLLPSPACVAPSTKVGSVDEHDDFVPNVAPPTGYSFLVEGCAADADAGAGVTTAPATMVVESPPVTVGGLTMTAFFGADAHGVVRAAGSLTADAISLGGNLIGPGKGSMTAILVPGGEVPPGVPPAPAQVPDGGQKDGGP
jgi:hypothetical protein